MSAIRLDRLKKEITELAWKYTIPVEFHRRLSAILDTYGDHNYRPGEGVYMTRLIQTYRTPPLVLNQIEKELVRLSAENPGVGLDLAAELWKGDHLETRRLGAFLLGQAPVNPPDSVLEMIRSWCKAEEETISVRTALQYGGQRLRREKPNAWLELARDWALRTETEEICLYALTLLVHEPEFENLPPVYQIVSSMIRQARPTLANELIELLAILDRRSPVETFFYLRQVTLLYPYPPVLRLMRRLLPELSPETGKRLREVLAGVSQQEPGESAKP